MEAIKEKRKQKTRVDVLWNRAADFVQKNKHYISFIASRYQPFTNASDQKDFMQIAYITAYELLKITDSRGTEMNMQYFIKAFKAGCSQTSTVPTTQIDENQPCRFISLQWPENNMQMDIIDHKAKTPLDNCIEKEEDTKKDMNNAAIIEKTLDLMTPKEKRVWKYLLGFYGRIPKLDDIAKELKISKAGVQKLRDSGLNYISAAYKNHNKIYSVAEASKILAQPKEKIHHSIRSGALTKNVHYLKRLRTDKIVAITELGLMKLQETIC